MKKLIGRTDVEDALKRLDKLTREEARMATTEVLKAMHVLQLDGKEAREVMRQAADDVDQIKRSSSPNLMGSDCGGSYSSRDPVMGQHS